MTAEDMRDPYTPWYDWGFDYTTGAGFVNALNAIEKASDMNIKSVRNSKSTKTVKSTKSEKTTRGFGTGGTRHQLRNRNLRVPSALQADTEELSNTWDTNETLSYEEYYGYFD